MLRKILLTAVMTVMLGVLSTFATADVKDSLLVQSVRCEISSMAQIRKATTLKPVSVKMSGRILSVESSVNQILPVYCNTGMLYCTFRLSKGNNIISGLPRGSYLINNRKYVIT